jgi:ubiquinone/menaquinone biosynthesis C-methylase UbiE
MVGEKSRFDTTGPSWSERASYGGLEAVLSPTGPGRQNKFIHGVHLNAASRALRQLSPGARIIDFGCGNGRFVRYLAGHGLNVLGTEITPEMIAGAKKGYEDENCQFALTDGITLPVEDRSIDGIWCCAVLRYSLLVPNPAYAQIAAEMFRVLRPGAYVFNCEMYLDTPPDPFIPDFEKAGFETQNVLLLHRYSGRLERILGHRLVSEGLMTQAGRLCAVLRSAFDNPKRPVTGLRDYLFVWRKPTSA